MEANIGNWDRWLRLGAGAVLIVLAVAGEGMSWGWLGVYPLATGLLRHSPLYRLLGINTCGC